jgi:hypothetical protein
MARFIKLHREILKKELEIADVYVNVENIVAVRKQWGNSKFTYVALTSTFEEVIESPEEIMALINHPCRY